VVCGPLGAEHMVHCWNKRFSWPDEYVEISDCEECYLLEYNSCSPLKAKLQFGKTYRLHLQEIPSQIFSRLFLVRVILRPCRWRWYVPLKRWRAFNGRHCVISQKINIHNHCCENLESISIGAQSNTWNPSSGYLYPTMRRSSVHSERRYDFRLCHCIHAWIREQRGPTGSTCHLLLLLFVTRHPFSAAYMIFARTASLS
jgi:hypothetical protein